MISSVMRAIVFDQSRLWLDAARWTPHPGPGEALIRLILAGVCATDLAILQGYGGFSGILGHEFVGQVESAPDAPHWVGCRVVGEINLACLTCPTCQKGEQSHCQRRTVLGILGRDGVFADYLTLPIANLHVVPEGVADQVALFAEPLAAAIEILQQLHIRPTDRVVVVGDGKLGLLVAQVMSLIGCELTVIGHHSENWSVLSDRQIPACLASDLPDDLCGDVVVECSGNPSGFALARRLVRPRGRLVLKSAFLSPFALDAAALTVDEITLVGSRCGPFAAALRLLAKGVVAVEPLIDRIFPLEEGVDALARAKEKGVLKVLLRP